MTAMKAIFVPWKIWIAVSLAALSLSCLQVEAELSWQGGGTLWRFSYSYPRYLADLTQAGSDMPAFFLPTSEEQWTWIQEEYGLNGTFQRREEGEQYRVILEVRNAPNNQLNRWLPVAIQASGTRMQITLESPEEKILQGAVEESAAQGFLELRVRREGGASSWDNWIQEEPGLYGNRWNLNEILEWEEEQIMILEWSNG